MRHNDLDNKKKKKNAGTFSMQTKITCALMKGNPLR